MVKKVNELNEMQLFYITVAISKKYGTELAAEDKKRQYFINKYKNKKKAIESSTEKLKNHINNFIVYYKTPDNKFRTYNYETKEYQTVNMIDNLNINAFEMFKGFGYKNTDENLKKNTHDWIIGRNRLLELKIISKTVKVCSIIDIFDNSLITTEGPYKDKIYYRSNYKNVMRFVKDLRKKDKHWNMDVIELYESEYFDKCYNSGVIYHRNGMYENVTTYDKKQFYSSILGNWTYDFEFPVVKGKIKKLKNRIPKKFQYGIYNIKVESNDENFNKIFSYSKDDHYTHYSLNFVLDYNKEYGDTVLLTIVNRECLVYEDDRTDDNKYDGSIVKNSYVFGKWFDKLRELKDKYPDDQIIKNLMSATWGYLSQKNSKWYSEDEVTNNEMDIGHSNDVNENQYFIENMKQKNDTSIYKLRDLSKPIYKYQFRLKPFATSFARVVIAKQALRHIDKVIRIQIDSISYVDLDEDLTTKDFIIDPNHTGKKVQLSGHSFKLIDKFF